MPRGDGYYRRKGRILYWEFMYKGRRYTVRLGDITKSEARKIVAEIKTKIISGEWEKDRKREVMMEELIHTRARKKAVETQMRRLERFKEFFGGIRTV